MTKTYVLEYRCRRCGELFNGEQVEQLSIDQVMWTIDEVVHNKAPSADLDNTEISFPEWSHNCPDGGIGVGDLAGAREDRELPPPNRGSTEGIQYDIATADTEPLPIYPIANGAYPLNTGRAPSTVTDLQVEMSATFDRPGTWKITIDQDMRGSMEEVTE